MAVVTNQLVQSILTSVDTLVTHVGIGTGSAPTDQSVALSGEVARKQAITYTDSNTIIKEVFFDESEVNDVQLTNAGSFGVGATDVVGTGALLTGGLIDVFKNNRQSLTVSMEITVEAINT